MKSSVTTLKHAVKVLKDHHRMHVESITRMASHPVGRPGPGLVHQLSISQCRTSHRAVLSFDYAIALQGWDSVFLICNLMGEGRIEDGFQEQTWKRDKEGLQ